MGYAGTIALRFAVSNGVALRFDFEDYIYESKFLFRNVEGEGQLQLDFILAAGLSIGFGG